MANTKTEIEWTDATWSPVTGCSKVSPGCANCYAEALSTRFGRTSLPWIPEHAATNVRLHPERFGAPVKWRKGRRIFVNSMSDLFHEQVPDSFLVEAFGVMALAEQHTFQVLTKRARRMAEFIEQYRPPLSNVWLGVSVENQRMAVERIPYLMLTAAAVRFLSIEPLLGPIDLRKLDRPFYEPGHSTGREVYPLDGLMAIPDCDWDVGKIDWVIVGGESGGSDKRRLAYKPTGRPWAPKPHALQWVRSLRDQCTAAGVPFFFKQWGGPTHATAGRLLGGREWSEFPADSGIRPFAN